jgi:hypothetical protein
MLGPALVIDSVLVCAVASLAQCAESGGAPYISELMLLCKRGGAAFVPWLSLAAFTAFVLVQLVAMQRAAVRWRLLAARKKTEQVSNAYEGKDMPGGLFWGLAAMAVAGFACVVACDWRDAGAAATAGHRAGVVLLAFGGFGALQVVWWTLREGDASAKVQHFSVLHKGSVPWYSWVEVDALFVVVLAVFMVTTLAGEHPVLSAVCEYVAFALLLVQTTWLLVLCAERERVSREVAEFGTASIAFGGDAGVHGMGWALGALLVLYAVEGLVVLAVVL